jgi:hypothetical protein
VTDRPVLRVVAGGDPSDEEVAALVTALSVVAARRTGTRQQRLDRWTASGRAAAPGYARGWLASGRFRSLRRP